MVGFPIKSFGLLKHINPEAASTIYIEYRDTVKELEMQRKYFKSELLRHNIFTMDTWSCEIIFGSRT